MIDAEKIFGYPVIIMQITRMQGIGVIVGAVILATVTYGGWHVIGPGRDLYRGLVTTADIQMTAEMRTLLEQRIKTTQASIEAQGKDVDLDLYILLANDASLVGDLILAREAAQAAVDGNPLNYGALNLLGTIAEDMHDYDAARSAYKAAVDQHSGVIELYRDYVILLQARWPEEQGEIKVALEKSIEDSGRNSWNMLELAHWYRKAGECDQALDHYDIAISLEPENAELRVGRNQFRDLCKGTNN